MADGENIGEPAANATVEAPLELRLPRLVNDPPVILTLTGVADGCMLLSSRLIAVLESLPKLWSWPALLSPPEPLGVLFWWWLAIGVEAESIGRLCISELLGICGGEDTKK